MFTKIHIIVCFMGFLATFKAQENQGGGGFDPTKFFNGGNVISNYEPTKFIGNFNGGIPGVDNITNTFSGSGGSNNPSEWIKPYQQYIPGGGSPTGNIPGFDNITSNFPGSGGSNNPSEWIKPYQQYIPGGGNPTGNIPGFDNITSNFPNAGNYNPSEIIKPYQQYIPGNITNNIPGTGGHY